jgi:hypothetical protein
MISVTEMNYCNTDNSKKNPTCSYFLIVLIYTNLQLCIILLGSN